MSLPEEHFRKTEELLRAIDKSKIAHWLLNSGYFPELYVLPPSFFVSNFELQEKRYHKDLKDLASREIQTISYPKSEYTYRVFGIQHPWNYHDIVFTMMEKQGNSGNWNTIIEHIFHKELKIFSYSFPIPLDARNKSDLSSLRSGRMIYEWIEMAEKDMVSEACKYKFIIRSDISNFYNSIYTHSIAWALHGRENAHEDKDYKLFGCKIDRLVQYANRGTTNGIPIGSALSDLIAEIILSKIDREVSNKLNEIDFIGARFKDDYRILCHSEEDAKRIIMVLAKELESFNLCINEKKTVVLTLPTGLYRQHELEYRPYSLRHKKEIYFRTFETTLLKVIDIHREYSGTSLIEKFLSELFTKEHEIKITYSRHKETRKKQILKTLSLLILLKRESEKILCHVLAIIELLYSKYRTDFDLKSIIKSLVESEIKNASAKKSYFELVWFIFLSRYLGLGIKDEKFKELGVIESENQFLHSTIKSEQKIFKCSRITLFRAPKYCKGITLARQLAVFEREEINSE